jgi:hypothetical protein
MPGSLLLEMVFMRLLASLLLVTGLALPAAAAADVVFPPGSRIGLAPPPGMVVSKRFAGFESRTRTAIITTVEMPPEAFRDVSAGLTADNLKRDGVTVTSRETFRVGDSEAVLVSGDQAVGPAPQRRWMLAVANPTVTAFVVVQMLSTAPPDAAAEMEKALKTIAIREPRPMDERLSALPFRLGDLAGFRPVRILGGNSVLLTDGPKDDMGDLEQPALIVAQGNAPPPREQRDAFARAALRGNPTLKDVRMERAQGFRQRGADWHEIVATATDVATGRPVVVAQTLRFGSDDYVRVFGIAKAEARDGVLSRFRTVTDAIEAD